MPRRAQSLARLRHARTTSLPCVSAYA